LAEIQTHFQRLLAQPFEAFHLGQILLIRPQRGDLSSILLANQPAACIEQPRAEARLIHAALRSPSSQFSVLLRQSVVVRLEVWVGRA
jgi:hypothetical protein